MKYLTIILLVFFISCKSYKYVPTTKRAAKTALNREVRQVKNRTLRVEAIARAYPDLSDTVTVSVPVDVVSEAETDTLEIFVQDTAAIDSLTNVVDRLLTSLIDTCDTVVINQIKWMLREVEREAIVQDTSTSFVITRKIKIDGVEVSAFTDVTIGIKDGTLFEEYQMRPIDTSVFLESKTVTFDVRKLPKFLQMGLGLLGVIIIIVIVLLIYRVAKKFIPFI